MATAAGLSYPSWTHGYIPFEWCIVGRWRNTVLLLTFACVGFYKAARVVQMTAQLELYQGNKEYFKNATKQSKQTHLESK